MVTLHTNHGAITIELNHDEAPETAANFLQYAKDGFFEGTLFHRVIEGFMIQGGGLQPNMVNKPARPPIKNEATNGLANDVGTVAMARTSDPHSASSQFFINVADNTFLNHKAPRGNDWGYCVFGKVTEGMDVVHTIAAVPTTSKRGHSDVPVEDVIIEKVVIDE